MSRIFILDAMNLAFRFFHTPGGGAKPETALRSASGELTGITYGFARLLRNIYSRERPTHIVVALDSPLSRRREMYDLYKSNRNGRPDYLEGQLPLVLQFLRTIGIQTVQVDGEEADDVAGSIAVAAEKAGMTAAIVSGDKDFLQLVGGNIFVFCNSSKDPTYYLQGTDAAKARFGVTPDKVVDMLAIMGDTSDCIPGVKGIGEKGALKLIEQFGSLEAIYERLGEVKSDSVRKKLEDSGYMAFLSKKLATINTNVAGMAEMLDSFRIEANPLNTEAARAFLARLDIKSI